MKGQVFSLEFLIYAMIVLFILFSLRDLVLRHNGIFLSEEKREISKLVLEYKTSEVLRRISVNPNEVLIMDPNVDGVLVRFISTDGREIVYGNLDCEERVSEKRFVLDENGDLWALVVERCVG